MRYFAAVLVLASGAAAQDAMEIVQKVEAKYRAPKSYLAEAESHSTHVRLGGESRNREVYRTVYRAPSSYRRESIEGSVPGIVSLSNGEVSVTIQPQLKEYIERKVTPRPGGEGNFMENVLSRVAEKAESAAIAREETIETAGVARLCWVIEVKPKPETNPQPRMPVTLSQTLWVEKESMTVWKSIQRSELKDPFMGKMSMAMEQRFRRVEFGPELPDSLFTYVPPPEFKKVDQFDFGSMMRRPNGSLEGKAAPGFSLTSVDGKTVSLESLRGKVVLLNFWATWCMPCRAEMPFVELLHRTFREKGLTVLGIDSEDREVAAAYLTKNGYTLPSLLDPDKKAHDDYGARGIPTTVLIDREGKVVFSAAGNMANAELREQLAQLGIW